MTGAIKSRCRQRKARSLSASSTIKMMPVSDAPWVMTEIRSRARAVMAWAEGIAYVHRDIAVCHRNERAGMQHFCSKPGEPRGLRVGKARQQTCIRHDARIRA